MRASFIRDMIDRRELCVDHCPGDLQIADLFTKVLPGPRHQVLSGMLGLGPVDLGVVVANVACSVPCSGAALSKDQLKLRIMLWILIIMMQINACVGDDGDEDDPTPVGPELSLLVLLLTLSVLFVWEAGKACISRCCSRPEAQVAALRVEDDEHQERRTRRQEAIRRAIASETEGLRRRRDPGLLDQGVSETPLHPLVHVQVEAPRPPPPVDQSSSPSVQAQASSSCSPPPPAYPPIAVPPPPVPDRGLVRELPARREVGTQTDATRGITYRELHDIQVLTSTSRTPGVVHLFPECHALRGVTTNRRQFCRICLQAAARTGT